MYTINAENVNDAYRRGMALLSSRGVLAPSRAGGVIVVPCPVTTVYYNPMQRVLFNADRDANPVFHLMEALWMLNGRRDAAWLNRFVGDFGKRFAEEDGNLHGAYGFRWRNHFDMEGGGGETLPDQLTTVISMLRANPDDRRVVLQMWDPVADLGVNKRDVPCNLTVLPRCCEGQLDITVFCRSNDAIWGAYGANAVHFSVLQEYIAAKLHVPVGKYYQISNNFHAYRAIYDKLLVSSAIPDATYESAAQATPIVDPTIFDDELRRFFEYCEGPDDAVGVFTTDGFFARVAIPMFQAYVNRKDTKRLDHELAKMPPKADWTVAFKAWLERRRLIVPELTS